MDEVTRLQSDMSQLTKRVDDMTLRLALVENEQKYVDEKISDIKVLIIEKNQDLRDEFARDIKTLTAVVDRGNAQQSKFAFWFVTVVGGVLILALLNLIVKTPIL